MNEIFSIGCSILEISEFINLLKKFEITALADIRSTPYSKFTPQFNADSLKAVLNDNNIVYLSFANEFGARRNEDSHYTNNKVDFNKVIDSNIFNQGVERINKGIEKGFKIAIMCTEKDPIECHRFSMVSRGLSLKSKIKINHILTNGNSESQNELENRLIKKYSLQPDFFIDDILNKAYELVNSEIGYTLNGDDND